MILFETLNQPYIFMWLILSGFLCGILFDIAYIISFLCNNNKIAKNILQAVATVLCFFVLFIINLKINYGQIRIYVFAVFFICLFIERITLGKIIAKTRDWCYNVFKKFTKLLIKGLTKVKRNGKQKQKT